MKLYKDIEGTIEAKIGDPVAVIISAALTFCQPDESKRPILGEDVDPEFGFYLFDRHVSMVSTKPVDLDGEEK